MLTKDMPAAAEPAVEDRKPPALPTIPLDSRIECRLPDRFRFDRHSSPSTIRVPTDRVEQLTCIFVHTQIEHILKFSSRVNFELDGITDLYRNAARIQETDNVLDAASFLDTFAATITRLHAAITTLHNAVSYAKVAATLYPNERDDYEMEKSAGRTLPSSPHRCNINALAVNRTPEAPDTPDAPDARYFPTVTGIDENVLPPEPPSDDFDLFGEDFGEPDEALDTELRPSLPDFCDPAVFETPVSHKLAVASPIVFDDEDDAMDTESDLTFETDDDDLSNLESNAYEFSCQTQCAKWSGGNPTDHPLPPTPPRPSQKLTADDLWESAIHEIDPLFLDSCDLHPLHDPATIGVSSWPDRHQNIMTLATALSNECAVPLTQLFQSDFFPLGYTAKSIRSAVLDLYNNLRMNTADSRMTKQSDSYDSLATLFHLILITAKEIFHSNFPLEATIPEYVGLDGFLEVPDESPAFQCLAVTVITLQVTRFILVKLERKRQPADHQIPMGLHSALFGGDLGRQIDIAFELYSSFGHLSPFWMQLASEIPELLTLLPGPIVPEALRGNNTQRCGSIPHLQVPSVSFANLIQEERIDAIAICERLMSNNPSFDTSNTDDSCLLAQRFLPILRTLGDQAKSICRYPSLLAKTTSGSPMASDILVNQYFHLQARPVTIPFTFDDERLKVAPVLCHNTASNAPLPENRFLDGHLSYYDATFDVQVVDPTKCSPFDVLVATPLYASLMAVRIRCLEDLDSKLSDCDLFPEEHCLIWDVDNSNPLVEANGNGGTITRYHGNILANGGDNKSLDLPQHVHTGWDSVTPTTISNQQMLDMVVSTDCVLVSAENDSSLFQDLWTMTGPKFDAQKRARMVVAIDKLVLFRRCFPLDSKDRAVRGIIRNPFYKGDESASIHPEFVETWVFRTFAEICDAARKRYDIFPRGAYLHSMSDNELSIYESDTHYLSSNLCCSPLYSFERFGRTRPARRSYDSLPIGEGMSSLFRRDSFCNDSLTNLFQQGIIHSDTTPIEIVMGWNEPTNSIEIDRPPTSFPIIMYDTSEHDLYPSDTLLEALMVVETRSSTKRRNSAPQAFDTNNTYETTIVNDPQREFYSTKIVDSTPKDDPSRDETAIRNPDSDVAVPTDNEPHETNSVDYTPAGSTYQARETDDTGFQDNALLSQTTEPLGNLLHREHVSPHFDFIQVEPKHSFRSQNPEIRHKTDKSSYEDRLRNNYYTILDEDTNPPAEVPFQSTHPRKASPKVISTSSSRQPPSRKPSPPPPDPNPPPRSSGLVYPLRVQESPRPTPFPALSHPSHHRHPSDPSEPSEPTVYPNDDDNNNTNDGRDGGKKPPSSEDLTKTLMKHARNSRLQTLDYPTDLNLRRRHFNNFIDKLMIVCQISIWTADIFDDWPHSINYDHDAVGTALYNVIFSYVNNACQKHLLRGPFDGRNALVVLRRYMAPLTPNYIDKVDETFRSLKQSPKEIATSYFTRINETDRDCFHAGINLDNDALIKRALQGASNHYLYAVTYENYRTMIKMAQKQQTELPRYVELESDLLDIDETNGVSLPGQRTRDYNQHGAYSVTDQRHSTPRPRGQHNTYSNRQQSFRPPNHQQRISTRNNTCSFCIKRGHTWSECRSRLNTHRGNQPHRPPNHNNVRNPEQRSNNHARAYAVTNHNNRNRLTNAGASHNRQNQATSYQPICNTCGQPGHYSPNCPRRQNTNTVQRGTNNRGAPRNNGGPRRPNQQSRVSDHAYSAYDIIPDANDTEHFETAFYTWSEADFGPNSITHLPNHGDASTFAQTTMQTDSEDSQGLASPAISADQTSADDDDDSEHTNESLPSIPYARIVPNQHHTGPQYFPEDPTSENQRFGNCDLINWTPDSGATSHFTPVKSDLINPIPCNNPVRVADGAICESKWVGSVEIHFLSNLGKPCALRLHRVYYVPGLNKRLLSLTTLSGSDNFEVTIRQRATTIAMPDRSTFTWPVRIRQWHNNGHNHVEDNFALSCVDNSTPLHNQGDTVGSFAHPENQNHNITTDHAAKQLSQSQKYKKSIPLELFSRRMAYKNMKTLLTGSLHEVWHNTTLTPTTTTDDWPVRVSISHKHARNKESQRGSTTPFHTIHMDLIHNPFRYSITETTNWEYYLFLVATPGRYCGWVGLPSNHSSSLFTALQTWLTDTTLLGRINDVRFIRTDAGTAFLSEEFIAKCVTLGIKVEAAAPRHQEMNGICEAKWKQVHNTANIMLNNARLGGAFFHHAHAYAVNVINSLPARNVVDENGLPSTPYYVCFGRKPKIANFRVFGCPTFFKVVSPRSGRGIITKQQQLQRACRGIFVGFPNNSAGWLVYSVQLPARLAISQDVYFDESFESALSFDSKPFAAAVPIRSAKDPSAMTTSISSSEATPIPRTGNVADLGLSLSSFVGNNDNDIVEEGELTSEEPLNQKQQPKNNYINHYMEDPAPEHDEPDEDQEQDDKSTITTKEDFNSEALTTVNDDYKECGDWIPTNDPYHEAMQAVDFSSEPNSTEPVDKYLPEPQTLKAVLRQPPEIRNAWLHAIYLEIKNLVDNDTFILGETMRQDELLVQTKIVNKAKQTATGLLEKLKSRIVARGDMIKRRMKRRAREHAEAIQSQKVENLEAQRMGHTPQIVDIPEPYEDTWSPCASSRGVKMLIADICRERRILKGADFIGAYLQAKIIGRHFIMLPKELAEFFPQYSKYFGVPLLLNKGMYGLVFSGKAWNTEFSEWLYSQGFCQSSADPSLFIKRFKHDHWIKLIFFVDDMLYAGSNDAIEKQFERDVQNRFHVKFQGPAQWFLQMRIHRHKDESYTLDQHRYALNTLKRFDPDGTIKTRETPLPPDYIYSKDNRPQTDQDRAEVERNYHFIHFRSAVCTLLYAAYNTRADILFAVCKLAKACTCPGMKDYDALIWLLGYLKLKPNLAIKFYPDRNKNPIYNICLANSIPYSDITIFTDASWQDCPDTGRSTVGYMIFYQGALIEANSTVPTPVAMSTAEAEFMGACTGAMAAAHIRTILYDFMNLGTKNWKATEQSLPTTPNILMIDNEAVVQMAKSGRMTRKTRHIERRFHFVRQGQDNGLHKLQWIPGEFQLADVQTKSQEAAKIDPLIKQALYALPKWMTATPTKNK